MSPYTLRMHSTNSNEVLSLHTQNALNQLKSSALLTHSECTQPTQIKCSPYTLRMHSTKTPQEAWSGRKPDVYHLSVFGCKAFAHVPDEKRTKLDPSPCLVCF
jgi:hypothetical protein